MHAEQRRHSLRPALLLCAGLLFAPLLPAAEEQIFEPGSKHVCVPAASGEGWDCRSAEDGAAAPAASPKKDAREPKLRSSRDVPAEAQTTAAASEQAAAVAPIAEAPAAPAPAAAAATASARPPAPPVESSRRLPNYLLSPEAQSAPAAAPRAASTPPAAAASTPATAPAAAEAPAARTAAAPTPSAAPVTAAPEPASTSAPARATSSAAPAATADNSAAAPRHAETAAPAAQRESAAAEPPATPARSQPPEAIPAAAPEPPPARSAALTNLLGSGEFRRLGDGRFVLELASGADRGAVEDRVAGLALGRGNIYLLPLQRDGAPWFVAAWGDFDSVDAARAARNEAAAAGATPGFPRRVGPLKQELR